LVGHIKKWKTTAVIEGRIQVKATRGSKIIEMLSDLKEKKTPNTSK